LLATIAGQIISLAVGPVARLRTRAFYVLHQHSSWHDVHEELLFWQTQTRFLKGQPIWFGAGITHIAFSDANSMGYGGYVLESGPHVAHGEWSESEASRSSTWERKPHLLDGAMNVFETCFQHGIRLQMQWIPRSLNDKADYFSYSGL